MRCVYHYCCTIIRAVTAALLKEDFDIDIDIPDDRICPAVPNRLNYLCWLSELIDNFCGSGALTSDAVSVMDVGVGACGVYPFLGHKKFGWKFVGTEIDPSSFEYATNNVAKNDLGDVIQVVLTEDSCALQSAIVEILKAKNFCSSKSESAITSSNDNISKCVFVSDSLSSNGESTAPKSTVKAAADSITLPSDLHGLINSCLGAVAFASTNQSSNVDRLRGPLRSGLHSLGLSALVEYAETPLPLPTQSGDEENASALPVEKQCCIEAPSGHWSSAMSPLFTAVMTNPPFYNLEEHVSTSYIFCSGLLFSSQIHLLLFCSMCPDTDERSYCMHGRCM